MLNKIKSKIKLTPEDEKVSFNLDSIYKGHYNILYKGVPAIKCPFDYVILQMIIFEVKPDLIIEIGSSSGGTALYMADLLEANRIEGEIHTIDVTNNAFENVKSNSRIKFFNNGWENYDLSLIKKFKKVMVIEDAVHSYECTLGAIEKFAPFVSLNSYLIVEDGIVDKLNMVQHFNGGPLRAIREFLPKNSEFVVDRKWCDMFGSNATFNVNGYLKRIKI